MKIAAIATSVLLLTFNATYAQDIISNLISHWPFTNVSNSTPDVYGGNDLALVNLTSTNLVPGKRGNCLRFNGLDQCLELTHSSDSETTGLPIFSTNGYTVSFWVNGPPGQYNKTIFAEGKTGQTGPLFNLATKKYQPFLDVFLRDDTGRILIKNIPSVSNVLDNSWHYIAWCDLNGACALYVDGQLDSAKFNYTFDASITLDYTSVGALYRDPQANFFQGSIEELAIWSRVLSQSEVRSVMTNGIPLTLQGAHLRGHEKR